MEDRSFTMLNKTLLLATILVAGILLFFVGQTIFQSIALDRQNQNQINVSGEGKVYAKPDVATVSLGVTDSAIDVSSVLGKTTDKVNAIIKAVKALGVEEKDIQTTQYSINPQYNWNKDGGRTFNGYTTSQTIEVKIRDFTKIGQILQKATDNGANNVGDLQFTIDNPGQLKEQAREKAIVQAKANAKNLAEKSGIKLGKLINVYESYYPVMYSAKGMGGVEAMDSQSAPAPVIQPGQQEINITINLTYQVR